MRLSGNKYVAALKRCLLVVLLLAGGSLWAKDVYPDVPNPPRLVNDFAHMLNTGEEERLEHKLEGFARTTSTQITIVTVEDLQGHDVSDYTVHVFNKWGIGQKGKNNGVLVLVSKNDRKAWITTGKGLEGVLTDAKTSRIFRNELRPAFKQGAYYEGLDKTADAIIAVTKGEYTADKAVDGGGGVPIGGIILFIIFIIIIIIVKGRGGGRGGGGYMSNRGAGDIIAGMLLNEMLQGGRHRGGGGWGGGGSDWGGGGFGGFGGGSSGGGGAGGSW